MRGPQFVAVVATKGGAGKTTSSVALAARLNSLYPGAVELLDLDPQQTASDWLPELARFVSVSSATELRAEVGDDKTIVVLDTPPGARDEAILAMEVADVLVAVTGLGPGDLKGMAHLCRMIDPDLVVPTQYDRRRSLHGEALDILSRQFGDKLTMPVPEAAVVERAQGAKQPLGDNTPPGVAYANAASRLITLLERK